jgi:catechol 2,3-dioxygenase-like lactoylglutathione lyase family enzyme
MLYADSYHTTWKGTDYMIKNRQSDHVGIAVNNLNETVSWYVEVLGFEVIGDFAAPDGTPCKFLKNADIVFEIFQPINKIKPKVAGKIDHYAFRSENIEKDYEYCKAQGYHFTTDGIQQIPTFWEHGIRYFKIASPTGEEMEFCEVLK